jgi:DNA-binding protein YbaB
LKFKRKKIAKNLVVTLLLILLMGCSVAFGVGYSKQITAYFYNIQVKLDGNPLKFSNEPFIYNDSVYIPLRDVSENLGIEVKWDGNTKTVYLAKKITTPSYNNYNNSYESYYKQQYTFIEKKSIKDIQKKLNDDYEKYKDGEEDLEFKYSLDEKSRYIKVEIEGQNFKRDSSDWKKRDTKDFRDFIEDIVKLIKDDFEKDIKIFVYDEKNKEAGEYEYDEDKKEFKIISEYGETVGLEDMEDELEDDYKEYTKGKEDFEFKYSLDDKSDYIEVEMESNDFKRSSSDWDKRDTKDFRKFVKNIAEKVADEFNKDVEIQVKDKDNKIAAKYEYDESKDDFEVKYEEGTVDEEDDDEDLSSLEDTLNDDFEKYEDDNEDLEFTYSLEKKNNEIKVVMKGKNFEKDSSDWEKRDKEDFRKFVEDVAEKVAKELDEDVDIYVNDEDGKYIAKYEYDESKKEFTVKDEPGSDDDDDKKSIDDVEKEIKKNYDEYTDGKEVLEFKYSLQKKSDYIKVEMDGKNFKINSSDWEKRDEDKFQDFVKKIAKDVAEELEEDVRVYVDDEDGKDVGKYYYYEKKKEFEVKEEN